MARRRSTKSSPSVFWGKGLELRRIVTGSEIAASRRLRVRARQFLVSRIDARHGATGIVPDELDGAVVSSDFPSFDIDESRLLPEYLGWYSKTSAFVDDCRHASEGTTNRVRLQEQRLLNLRMALPPLEGQRRVVRKIERLAAHLQNMDSARGTSAGKLDAAATSAWSRIFPESQGTCLGDFASIQSGYAFKSEWFEPDGIRLVRNVNIAHGVITWSQTVRVSEARRPEFERFELRVGDILVSLDRPVISSGVKAAVVRETDVPSLLLQRVGRVLTHDLGLDSEYLFLWLQSPLFAAAIDPGRSNGVPHVSPKDLERVPFERPSMTTQKTMVERGRRLLSTQRRLDFLWRQTAAESDALMQSFLSIAFA